MLDSNYGGRWSSTQSFLASKCKNPNNFLKRNLKAFSALSTDCLEYLHTRKVKHTTFDTAENWEIFEENQERSCKIKQLKKSHFFTTLVITEVSETVTKEHREFPKVSGFVAYYSYLKANTYFVTEGTQL